MLPMARPCRSSSRLSAAAWTGAAQPAVAASTARQVAQTAPIAV